MVLDVYAKTILEQTETESITNVSLAYQKEDLNWNRYE